MFALISVLCLGMEWAKPWPLLDWQGLCFILVRGKPGAQTVTCPPAASPAGTALGAAFFPPAAGLLDPSALGIPRSAFPLGKGKPAVSLEWH